MTNISSQAQMLISEIFNTISAYLCNCSCQYCYHIKQTHCIFFSPKAFCDTQKVTRRRLRPGPRPGPGCGNSRRSPDPLVGWTLHPSSIFTPPQRLRCLDIGAYHFSEPLRNFFCIRPCIPARNSRT